MTGTALSQRTDFRALIDNLEGFTIWMASEPGSFDYVSDGFEDLWGIPPEAVEDDPDRLVEGVHPEDREAVVSIIARRGDDITDESLEHRVVQPDGTVKWVHARLFPLRGPDGEIEQMVGVTSDITDLKRRERELEALNRIVRHDIRNDMSIVLGWAEMLEDHVDEAGEDYLEKVLASGTHVVELTEIARDYVETLTGDGDVEVKPMALCSVLKKEMDLRRESFPHADFVLADDVPDVEVMADEMLSSIFRNLLNNAVQHNDRDDPHVEVSCEVDGDEAVVTVADDGPGIPADQRERIFQKGEKGLESSGTGIGLYLVWTLVEQYGGSVEVSDNEPRGSVFTVRLPLAES